MKKIVLGALALFTAAGLFAQSVPQPAFRLLDGYLDKQSKAAEYGAKNGSWVLMGTGLALGAASATVWYGSDSIARSAGRGPLSSEAKFGWTLGLGIGGAVLGGIGLAMNLFPPSFDQRAQYSAIYHETDPVLQESLAAARLKGMSETAKDTRVASGWVSLGITGVSLGLRAFTNNQAGRLWSDGLFSSWGWEAGSIAGGITSLLVKSPEESLYEEYLYVVARPTKS